jgi:hypothetical protein
MIDLTPLGVACWQHAHDTSFILVFRRRGVRRLRHYPRAPSRAAEKPGRDGAAGFYLQSIPSGILA